MWINGRPFDRLRDHILLLRDHILLLRHHIGCCIGVSEFVEGAIEPSEVNTDAETSSA